MVGKWSGYDEWRVLVAAVMVLGGYRMSFLEKCRNETVDFRLQNRGFSGRDRGESMGNDFSQRFRWVLT